MGKKNGSKNMTPTRKHSTLSICKDGNIFEIPNRASVPDSGNRMNATNDEKIEE